MAKFSKIKNIVFDALFLALIFVFAYVPYLGYITIGPLAFTTMHVLVLIGAILFGRKRGALYGFFFGLSSFFVAFQYPGTLNYFCLNPFISILPRILFGYISGLSFDFLRKLKSQKVFNAIAIPLCGVLTLLHTILYFICFYAFGVKDIFGITSLLGVSDLIDAMVNQYGSLMGFILGFMSIGCVCEIAVAIVVVGAIYIPINKYLGIGKVVGRSNEFSASNNFKIISVITILLTICVIILSMAL